MSAVDDTLHAHLPRLRAMASRLATPADVALDAEDLVQEGALGLLSAATRYDPLRHATPWTYAERRAEGAMLDAKRELDHVSRSVRTKARTIAQAAQALSQQLGRAPDGDEIAQALGVSLDTYEQWRTALVCTERLLSLDYLYDTGEAHVEHAAFLADPAPNLATQAEQRQRHAALTRTMSLLPVEERTVLRQYYWEERPLKTIGAALGVTESRACQLHAAALARLRRWLTVDAEWQDVCAQLAQRETARQAQAVARQDVLRTQGRTAYLRMWRKQQEEKTNRANCNL